MKNQPLFPSPPAVELELSKTNAPLADQRGAYSRYAPKNRVACDECVAFLHERRGAGPLPRSARMTRQALGVTLRLCVAHADLWRKLDEERAAKL